MEFGLLRSGCDHSIFYKHSNNGCILLVVYVDDIVIPRSDALGISGLKSFLHTKFQTKELGTLKYIFRD